MLQSCLGPQWLATQKLIADKIDSKKSPFEEERQKERREARLMSLAEKIPSGIVRQISQKDTLNGGQDQKYLRIGGHFAGQWFVEWTMRCVSFVHRNVIKNLWQ